MGADMPSRCDANDNAQSARIAIPKSSAGGVDLSAFDMDSLEGRQRAGQAVLKAVTGGAISAAVGTAAASILRTLNDQKVVKLQAQVAELSQYAADLERQLRALGQRGR